MCLAVPCTIKKIFADRSALAVINGVETEIRLDLIDSARVGDSVLVHAGFAIQKLDRQESRELEELWRELRKAAGDGPVIG